MTIEKAAVRPLGSIIGFAIHHAGFASPAVGAANLAALKARAAQYNALHAFRDSSSPPDGKNDAKFTGAEFGYPWILYHVMIARDGSVLQVQDFKYVRFHATDNWRLNTSLNLHGIGILFDGNFEYEVPTEASLRAAAKVIFDFEKSVGKQQLKVLGHRESSLPRYGTSCPGKNMGASTDPNSRLSKVIRYAADLHEIAPEPPVVNADKAKRLDELAYASAYVRNRVATVSGTARKDELRKLDAYIENRRGQLGG